MIFYLSSVHYPDGIGEAPLLESVQQDVHFLWRYMLEGMREVVWQTDEPHRRDELVRLIRGLRERTLFWEVFDFAMVVDHIATGFASYYLAKRTSPIKRRVMSLCTSHEARQSGQEIPFDRELFDMHFRVVYEKALREGKVYHAIENPSELGTSRTDIIEAINTCLEREGYKRSKRLTKRIQHYAQLLLSEQIDPSK